MSVVLFLFIVREILPSSGKSIFFGDSESQLKILFELNCYPKNVVVYYLEKV